MYLASNGVAYLGTAATRKNARGLGYHGALISHRIEQAKKHGSLVNAATAYLARKVAVICSDRAIYIARSGAMHAHALYRLADSETSAFGRVPPVLTGSCASILPPCPETSESLRLRSMVACGACR